MTNFDFSPLFRTMVGFDRLNRSLESALHVDESAVSYPPYNIEATGEDSYRITMAVAGFGKDDLSIETRENELVIVGRRSENGQTHNYLHRGIAGRNFERRFQLADYVRVADASLVDGLLHVDLKRELPEAMKPRTVGIKTVKPVTVGKVEKAAIEDQAAA